MQILNFMKNFFKKILKKLDIGIVRYAKLLSLQQYPKDIEKILNLTDEKIINFIKVKNKSKAELKQDLFVLLELNFKKNGFFVEFGATNGFSDSNTYLLEKEFKWSGILAEPNKIFYRKIKLNRSCYIENSCIYNSTGNFVNFVETRNPNLSTIDLFKNYDFHKKDRKKLKTYKVRTISLIDLLKKYNAPKIIDYLSIDTEGSEFEILKNFDFNLYTFKVITVEHNFNSYRKKIYDLLTNQGYKRKYIGLSNWDDWYVKN
jgi:FkbM family methyltransferase